MSHKTGNYGDDVEDINKVETYNSGICWLWLLCFLGSGFVSADTWGCCIFSTSEQFLLMDCVSINPLIL